MREARLQASGHLGLRQWQSQGWSSCYPLPSPFLPPNPYSVTWLGGGGLQAREGHLAGEWELRGGRKGCALGQSQRAPWRQRGGVRGSGADSGFGGHAGRSRHTHFLPRYLTSSHQLLLRSPTSLCFSEAPRGGSGTSVTSRIKATASRQGMI